MTASQAPWRSAEGRRSGRLACTHASRLHSAFQCSMDGEYLGPSRRPPCKRGRTPSVRAHDTLGGMGDDLDRHVPPRRRQRMGLRAGVLAHHPELPLAGNTDARQTRSRAQHLAVSLALPGGCLTGRPRWPPAEHSSEIEGFGPPGALHRVGARAGGLLGADFKWRRTRNARQNPRARIRPAGGRIAKPVPGSRRGGYSSPVSTSAAPKGRTSPSWPPAVPPA